MLTNGTNADGIVKIQPLDGDGMEIIMKLKQILPGIFLSLACSLPAFGGQWQQNQIGWWYQNDDNTWPASSWQWLDGNGDGIYQCYAFDEDGYLYVDTTTPDGFTVDPNGAWSDHGITQTRRFLGMAPTATPINTYSGGTISSGGSSTGSTSSAHSKNSARNSASGSHDSSVPVVHKVHIDHADGTNGSESSKSDNASAAPSDTSDAGSKKTDPVVPTVTGGTKKDANGPSGYMHSNTNYGSPTSDKQTHSSPAAANQTVYWDPEETTYHKDADCSKLHVHGEDLSSGSLMEAERNGITKACPVCAR